MMFSKAKDILLSPQRAFTQKRSSRQVFLYLLGMLVVFALLQGVAQLVLGVEAGGVVLVAGVSYVTGLVATLITGVWLHLWVLLMGGRGLGGTSRVVWYGSTPHFVFGWLVVVPGIGRYLRLALVIWSFVLYWVGLKQQGLSSKRAGLAAGLGLVVGFALFSLVAIVVVDYYIPLLLSS